MDEKVVLSLIAAGSAIVGGFISAIVGPVIKHRLDLSAARKIRQREQIHKWREMVLEVDRASGGNLDVGPTLQLHPEFLSLEPYLSEEARRSVYGQNRTLVVGQSLAKPLQTIKREIARVENEWSLR
jgi:hypothetical protein